MSFADMASKGLFYKGASNMERHTILNSWKEIAVYMGRAVRTVQRWEQECDFPVHRPRGKKRSAVFALPKEIDIWLERCPQSGDDFSQSLTNHILIDQRKTLDKIEPSSDARRILPAAASRIVTPRPAAR